MLLIANHAETTAAAAEPTPTITTTTAAAAAEGYIWSTYWNVAYHSPGAEPLERGW